MDFVTFEIAKKLKDLGFNEPFFFFYREDDKEKYVHHASISKPLIYCDKIDNEVIIAPAISQVLKWLREKHKIYMYVKRDTYHFKFRFVYEKDKPKVEFTSSVYDGFEQASIEGIKYVINKLIQ